MFERIVAWIRGDKQRVSELNESIVDLRRQINSLINQNDVLKQRAQEETAFANHEIERRQGLEKTYQELLSVHNALLQRHQEIVLYFNHQQRVVSVAMQKLKCQHIVSAESELELSDESYRSSLH